MGGRKATDELAELVGLVSGTRVLEVGCGTGASTRYIAERFGARVVAVDISPDMVGWARDRVARAGLDERVELRVADAHELPFDKDSFDAVVCESVTAFLDKPRALREFVRVARPDGRVGLNEATWIETPPEDAVDYMYSALGGAEFLAPDSWREILEDAGLVDIEVRIRSVSALEQWLSEVRQLGVRELTVAWGKMLMQLRTSPDTRDYLRSLWPPPRSLWSIFRYFGYGLYVGTKAGEGKAAGNEPVGHRSSG